MKKWLKVIISTPPVLVESISDFVVGVMGAGVEVGVEENLTLKTLSVYLEKENPSAMDIERGIECLSAHVQELAAIFGVDCPALEWQIIEEEDWAKNWKKHFAPFAITPDVVIVPTWEKYHPAENEIVVIMDPGMAFGTGHHATTSLALTMVEREMKKNAGCGSVLDVGTGTGILGMAAALMGAETVLAIDNDPVAVAAAAENAAKNMVSERMAVSDQPLSLIKQQYSLVIANIVHDVLAAMAADLYRVTEAGGRLILSGVLHGEQVASIVEKFTKSGFGFVEERKKDEWAALLFEKEW